MGNFKYKGKVYQINEKEYPKVNIPGIGERTAAEIELDEKAQAYLVEKGCVGTVITEAKASKAAKEPAAGTEPTE